MLILSWENVEYTYFSVWDIFANIVKKSFSRSYNRDRHERQSC